MGYPVHTNMLYHNFWWNFVLLVALPEELHSSVQPDLTAIFFAWPSCDHLINKQIIIWSYMKHIWKLSDWSIQCHNGPYMFHIRPYNDLFINKMVTRWPCKKR